MLSHVTIGTKSHEIPKRVIPLLASLDLAVDLEIFQRATSHRGGDVKPGVLPTNGALGGRVETRLSVGKSSIKSIKGFDKLSVIVE